MCSRVLGNFGLVVQFFLRSLLRVHLYTMIKMIPKYCFNKQKCQFFIKPENITISAAKSTFFKVSPSVSLIIFKIKLTNPKWNTLCLLFFGMSVFGRESRYGFHYSFSFDPYSLSSITILFKSANCLEFENASFSAYWWFVSYFFLNMKLQLCIFCSDFRYESNGIFVLGVGFFFFRQISTF